MTIDPAPARMDGAIKAHLHEAASRAPELYPGPVGDLLRQELLSWMVFGHRLGSTLILRVADELAPAPAEPVGRGSTTSR